MSASHYVSITAIKPKATKVSRGHHVAFLHATKYHIDKSRIFLEDQSQYIKILGILPLPPQNFAYYLLLLLQVVWTYNAGVRSSDNCCKKFVEAIRVFRKFKRGTHTLHSCPGA
jgi:hypothetical protein